MSNENSEPLDVLLLANWLILLAAGKNLSLPIPSFRYCFTTVRCGIWSFTDVSCFENRWKLGCMDRLFSRSINILNPKVF